MTAIATLFPVCFMLLLGYISRMKGWITPEQKEGVSVIIFKLLFPVLILNLMCTAKVETAHIKMIGYVMAVYILALVLGKLTASRTKNKYAHFSAYLLTIVEGGNVALPLYLSIVGPSSNTVIFDIAGIFIAFILFPVLIAKEASTASSKKAIMQSIITNPFVVFVIIGLFLNFTGVYQQLIHSSFGDMITNTFTQATAPIVSFILFGLGYDFHINPSNLAPLCKLLVIKFIYYAFVIVGFFILFPNQMSDETFMIAPIIYFMCPTGFSLMPLISPLYQKEDDAAFTSAFISMFLIVTLIVYTLLVFYFA